MPRNVRDYASRGGPKWKQKKGIASNYLNVSKILRRLDLTLKDFRRLCILKGLHPRNVPGKTGRLYYHKKDVTFLSHEPLIDKFRKLKTFMKRYKRAVGRGHKDTARRIKDQIPEITVDHLVRERYPTFLDAVRDYDDALNQLFLFRSLPVGVTISYTGPVANRVDRVCNEWHKYVADYQLLRKVFVSIKGYYLQADVRGCTVTWLVPHRVVQRPRQEGVDMSIMTTFLHFYQTLARFLNFKFFKDEGVAYPVAMPTDSEQVEAIFGKGAQAATAERTAAAALARTKGAPKTSADAKKLQAVVDRVSAKLTASKESDNQDDADEDVKEAEDDTDEFNRLDPTHTTSEDSRAARLKNLFKGKVFLIGREVAPEIISVVIRSAGGKCIHEHLLTPTQAASSVFTHQISDRKRPATLIASRIYVQPQWVFDSFNEAFALPIAPYGLGEKLPPHLSPFVNDERMGYVPAQREQLRQWAGNATKYQKARQLRTTAADEEAKYQEELRSEIKAVRKAQAAQEQKTTGDENSEVEMDDDVDVDMEDEDEDDFDEEDFEEDVEDDGEEAVEDDSEDEDLDLAESGDEEEEEAMKQAAASKKRKTAAASSEDDDDDEEDEEEEDVEEEEDDDEFAQFKAPEPVVPRPENVHVRDTDKERFRMTLKKKDRWMVDKSTRIKQFKKNATELLGQKRSAIEKGSDPNQIDTKKVLRQRR